MSAARRHKKHHHEEHDNHERWLVSGYDMMTFGLRVTEVLVADGIAVAPAGAAAAPADAPSGAAIPQPAA